MRKKNVVLNLYLLILLFMLKAPVQAAAKTAHPIPEISTKVKIDGKLTDSAWNDALKLDLNYEVMPGENIKPPAQTTVYLMYTKQTLYVAFDAQDPNPAEIRARIRERDNFTGDDWVGIALDTFNDERRTYNFYCNPLGVQMEEISSPEGGGEGWDAIWKSAGKINKKGFCVEMAIPFSSLRFQRKKENQTWGIDAIRSYPRNLRHMFSLFPWDRNNNCYMCQAEKIVGFAGAKPGKNIEITPTLTSLYTQEREDFTSGDFKKKEGTVEPGLTAQWGFTPNLTLNATINPDFSNVEADVPELDINTQFAIDYPEKRPFFLEGASIFNTRLRGVYTRSLAEPDWGVKIAGKEGANAIGFFSVQDNITNLMFPGNQRSRYASLNQSSVGSVVRYRRDIGKASTLGVLVTDRESTDYFNRVGGIDGDFRITPKDRIRVQFLGSNTQYSDEIATEYAQPTGNFWGTALDLYYIHDTKTVDWHLGYSDIGTDFRADLGFMPQGDYKNYDAGLGHNWYKRRGHWYTYINLASSLILKKDHDGNTLYKGTSSVLNYKGPMQSTLNLFANLGKRTYRGIEFDENKLFFNGGIRPSGNVFFFMRGIIGRGIHYSTLQAGNQFQFEGFVRYKMGRHLELLLDHKYEKFNVDAGRLYTANISYVRFVYHFTKKAFLRTILKYYNYKYNPALYTFNINPHMKHLFSQILFSYEFNPRTVLYLGYSDDYFGYEEIPVVQTNRTLFAKIGYAFVL
ncbi:MAG: carbohydrate binding family 9 domain-containing protein [bacterium]|nr:carbohydrate binding family 9 domain-containing protein [bacterium]